MAEPTFEIPPLEKQPEKRLDSWKEIASYLNRDVTTVQRWEKRERMPVHRHLHNKRGSVYALTEELDGWIQTRRSCPDEGFPEEALPDEAIANDSDLDENQTCEIRNKPETEAPPTAPAEDHVRSAGKARLWLALTAAVCLCLLASGWLVFRQGATARVGPRIRSLAVLPLRNLSGDPAQEYLADGMTEALIGRLSNIHDLRVISHTSVLRFKNPQLSLPEIARALGADAIVEGSVERGGDRIRVTAQLIRGATDQHFWSQTYDREMRDALTLESELAQSIAEKVEVTVTGEEYQRLSSAHPVAPEVYESYLKGRFALEQGDRVRLEQSIPFFEDALTRDTTFAPAYLGLAETYTMLGTVAAGEPPQATRPKVISFARKALAIDPSLVEAHVVLANVLQEQWHWTEAETEYRRAIELNPDNAEAYRWFAMWLVCEGRPSEAVTTIQRARALDPVGVTGGSVAWILFQAHHYDDAIREARSALALQPDNVGDLTGLGFALIANNQPGDAIPLLERAVSLSGSPAATGILIRAYAHAGRRRDAMRLLAELKRRRAAGYIPAGAFVNAYLGLDDKEQVFYWLEQAYKEQSNILQFLKSHPYFDPIRDDPRFADLVRRVGLG